MTLKYSTFRRLTRPLLTDINVQCSQKINPTLVYSSQLHNALKNISIGTLKLILACYGFQFLNCSRLSELSLDFLPYGNQTSDTKTDTLAAIMKNVGNTAKGLKRLHVASHLLDDRVVHALLSSGLRSVSVFKILIILFYLHPHKQYIEKVDPKDPKIVESHCN